MIAGALCYAHNIEPGKPLRNHTNPVKYSVCPIAPCAQLLCSLEASSTILKNWKYISEKDINSILL